MALSVVEAVAETASTSNAATYAGSAFTPAAGDRLLAFVTVSGNTAPASSMSGAWTWTPLQRITFNTTDSIHVFEARVTAGTSTTPTFATNNGNATGATINVHKWSGTNVQVKQSDAEARTGANPTITMPAALSTGNGYSAAFGMPRNPPTSTPPASWTETADTGYNTPAAGFSAAFRNGGETGSTITFTSASAAYGIVAVEVYEAPVTGSLSKTLDAATSSIAGTAIVDGDAAATLGAATSTAAGAVVIAGAASKTLDAASVVSGGTVANASASGELAATLGGATASGAGVVLVDGDLAGTLGAATSSGAGTVAVIGSFVGSLGSATATSVGTVAVDGDLSRSLGSATGSAAGAALIDGDLNSTLGSASGSSAGAVIAAGALAGNLDGATLGSTGGSAGSASGALTATLDSVTASSTGVVPVFVTASIGLEDASASATGAVPVFVTGSIGLDPATSAGAGSVPADGALSSTLDAAMLSSDCEGRLQAIAGGVSVTLGSARLYATDRPLPLPGVKRRSFGGAFGRYDIVWESGRRIVRRRAARR